MSPHGGEGRWAGLGGGIQTSFHTSHKNKPERDVLQDLRGLPLVAPHQSNGSQHRTRINWVSVWLVDLKSVTRIRWIQVPGRDSFRSACTCKRRCCIFFAFVLLRRGQCGVAGQLELQQQGSPAASGNWCVTITRWSEYKQGEISEL